MFGGSKTCFYGILQLIPRSVTNTNTLKHHAGLKVSPFPIFSLLVHFLTPSWGRRDKNRNQLRIPSAVCRPGPSLSLKPRPTAGGGGGGCYLLNPLLHTAHPGRWELATSLIALCCPSMVNTSLYTGTALNLHHLRTVRVGRQVISLYFRIFWHSLSQLPEQPASCCLVSFFPIRKQLQRASLGFFFVARVFPTDESDPSSRWGWVQPSRTPPPSTSTPKGDFRGFNRVGGVCGVC